MAEIKYVGSSDTAAVCREEHINHTSELRCIKESDVILTPDLIESAGEGEYRVKCGAVEYADHFYQRGALMLSEDFTPICHADALLLRIVSVSETELNCRDPGIGFSKEGQEGCLLTHSNSGPSDSAHSGSAHMDQEPTTVQYNTTNLAQSSVQTAEEMNSSEKSLRSSWAPGIVLSPLDSLYRQNFAMLSENEREGSDGRRNSMFIVGLLPKTLKLGGEFDIRHADTAGMLVGFELNCARTRWRMYMVHPQMIIHDRQAIQEDEQTSVHLYAGPPKTQSKSARIIPRAGEHIRAVSLPLPSECYLQQENSKEKDGRSDLNCYYEHEENNLNASPWEQDDSVSESSSSDDNDIATRLRKIQEADHEDGNLHAVVGNGSYRRGHLHDDASCHLTPSDWEVDDDDARTATTEDSFSDGEEGHDNAAREPSKNAKDEDKKRIYCPLYENRDLESACWLPLEPPEAPRLTIQCALVDRYYHHRDSNDAALEPGDENPTFEKRDLVGDVETSSKKVMLNEESRTRDAKRVWHGRRYLRKLIVDNFERSTPRRAAGELRQPERDQGLKDTSILDTLFGESDFTERNNEFDADAAKFRHRTKKLRVGIDRIAETVPKGATRPLPRSEDICVALQVNNRYEAVFERSRLSSATVELSDYRWVILTPSCDTRFKIEAMMMGRSE
ncbi:unnamed protein product [Amoebophrya sp. A25]|nr:unnamed protein product [Amoebophrya sp. A25]|eukprot:GSA25T00026998001.1